MNLDEALKLLNLDKDYTEEDLKREYRRLILEYHPDKHDGKDKIVYEEKTKLLNQAKEILSKNLKDRKSGDSKDETFDSYWEDIMDTWSNVDKEKYDDFCEREMEELARLKKEYKEELCDQLEYIYDIDSRDNIFFKWKDRFLEVIYDLYYCIDDQPNTLSLRINYQVYKKKYEELLYFYLYDHFSASKILDFVNGKFKIDDNDGLRILRNKMIRYMNVLLNMELDEFRMIDEYKDIESLLLKIRNGVIDLCLFGYIDIEKAKIDFKNKIILELIKYRKRKQLIGNLIKYYGYPNKLVIELSNNILNEDKFNSLYYGGVDTKTRIKAKIKNIFSK